MRSTSVISTGAFESAPHRLEAAEAAADHDHLRPRGRGAVRVRRHAVALRTPSYAADRSPGTTPSSLRRPHGRSRPSPAAARPLARPGPDRRARRAAGAARTAGCRRAGSREPPAACRCAPMAWNSMRACRRRASPAPSPSRPSRSRWRSARRRPSIANVLFAGQAQRCRAIVAGHELQRQRCPCRPGSSDGCARSSRRSRRARPAASAPWPPSRATSPSRTPCRPAPRAAFPLPGTARRRRRSSMHLAARQVAREAALDPGRQPVPDAPVGERAAHHHLMVAAARSVRVEVARLDAVLDQVAPGRRPRGGCCRPARCGRW